MIGLLFDVQQKWWSNVVMKELYSSILLPSYLHFYIQCCSLCLNIYFSCCFYYCYQSCWGSNEWVHHCILLISFWFSWIDTDFICVDIMKDLDFLRLWLVFTFFFFFFFCFFYKHSNFFRSFFFSFFFRKDAYLFFILLSLFFLSITF